MCSHSSKRRKRLSSIAQFNRSWYYRAIQDGHTSFSSTVGKVTKPYSNEFMLAFRATHAGTDWRELTVWKRLERSSSLTNSQRFPIKMVVSTMLSGRGTISYRSPPIIISAKSASRRLDTPRGPTEERILCVTVETFVCIGRFVPAVNAARRDWERTNENASVQ